MAYLGRGIENLSDRVVLDSLTASATASYTLQLNSVNFVPSSAESLTVSLNGVIQAPISSYTVSGSTIVFASSLSASDSIDFIIAERGITLATPSAGSVGTSQLASNAVTAAKINDGEITNAKINSSAAIATTKLGTGAVLQVVQGETSTQVDHTGSYADTGLSASITPTSTSNKILIQVSQHFRVQRYGGDIRILRDSTSIFEANASTTYTIYADPGSDIHYRGYVCLNYLDSPSSTSAITYKTQGVRHNPGGAFKTQDGNQFKSTITLMEIAG